MKRLIQSLILCMTLVMVSCQSSSESVSVLTPADIAGTYSGTKISSELNGQQVSASIAISGTEMSGMSVVLPATFIDTEAVTVPVKFSQKDGEICSFTGSTSFKGMGITVTGFVYDGKLTISITSALQPYSPTDIAGEYTAQTASVKVSGVALDLVNAVVKVEGSALNAMTITVPNKTMPGEQEIVFSNVQFTTAKACTFTGSSSNADRDIAISGSYSEGKLTVEITPKYKSSLVGVWNFQEPVEVDYVDESQVLVFDVMTPSGTVQFLGMTLPAEAIGPFFNTVLGQGMLRAHHSETKEYIGAIRNITFHADGNLTAEYNLKFMQEVTPEFVPSPKGALRWYIKGGEIFLVPNLNMMTKGISSDGIPMFINLSPNDVNIFVTKEQIAPVMGLLAPVIASLPDELLGELGPILKGVVTELGVMVQEATKFDLGVHFVRTASTPVQ